MYLLALVLAELGPYIYYMQEYHILFGIIVTLTLFVTRQTLEKEPTPLLFQKMQEGK